MEGRGGPRKIVHPEKFLRIGPDILASAWHDERTTLGERSTRVATAAVLQLLTNRLHCDLCTVYATRYTYMTRATHTHSRVCDVTLVGAIPVSSSMSIHQHVLCMYTHTRLTVLFPGLPGWASTRKVKPIWILLKQETVSGSGISWAICMSAPHSRQITTPAPHHSVFYRPDVL